jgi:hypothetical protein
MIWPFSKLWDAPLDPSFIGSSPNPTIRLNNVTIHIPRRVYQDVVRVFNREHRIHWYRNMAKHPGRWLKSVSEARYWSLLSLASEKIVTAILKKEGLPKGNMWFTLPKIGRCVTNAQLRFILEEFDELTWDIYELYPANGKKGT